jgi:regulator of RNase E activity RraA
MSEMKFVKLIRDLKLSSSDVADALSRGGRITKATQISGPPEVVVGPVFHVAAVEGSNWLTHVMLSHLPKGHVVYVDNFNCGELALVGGLICKYAIQHREALAVVVNGFVRDVEELRAEGMPVWACGSNPIVCSKEQTNTNFYCWLNRSVAVCDATGVIVAQPGELSDDLESKLKALAERESEWFNGLKEGKNTFQITCENQ